MELAESLSDEVESNSLIPPVVPVVEKLVSTLAYQEPAVVQRKQKSSADWLRSRKGLRQAIVSREILGPPKGM